MRRHGALNRKPSKQPRKHRGDSLAFEWSVARLTEIAAMRAAGYRGQALANEASRRWGVSVSRDSIKQATRRHRHRLPTQRLVDAFRRRARPPPPPDDAFEAEILEEAKVDQAPPLVKEDSILTPESGSRIVDDGRAGGEDRDSGGGVLHGPAIHTSRTRGEAYLILSDAQEPYGIKGGIAFALDVAREFGVDVEEPGRVLNVGDEADLASFSRFLKSPESPHNANTELDALRAKMGRWYRAFPRVKVCNSNHQQRIIKRAAEAGLPSQVLRAWRDLIAAPDGWDWADSWTVQASRQPFMVEHGHNGSQSVTGIRLRALANGIPTVIGHQTQGMVVPIRTPGVSSWAMCVGALIDREQVAFEYAKPLTWRPCIGVGVVVDGGLTPIWVPFGR